MVSASDGYGTPIRLWFDTGNTMLGLGEDINLPPMDLMATSISLSVERKVGGMSMPFTGGMRFALDLNMVNSTIIIEGIFVDDTHDRRVIAAQAANAYLDFALDSESWLSTGKLSPTPVANYAQLVDRPLTLKDKGGVECVISFAAANPISVAASTAYTSTINMGSPVSITAAQLATHIATAVNTTMSGTAIGATVTTSQLVPIAGSSLITLTAGATGSHSLGVTFAGSSGFIPYFRAFGGGYDGSTGNPKSAADKVQDLYGILHNTSRNELAIVGALVAGGVAVAAVALTGGLAAPVIGAGLAGGAAAGGLFNAKNDYPIGLQIPYKSMIQAVNTTEDYVARNFIQQTGWFKTVANKLSDNNTLSAGSDFVEGDDRSGIKGTIQKFDVGYAAGENVYTYQMVFAPIDMILA
tara:strand:+ start:2629 stop:3864 length:1236 start_codon:yes stop_codon:yes gene_type:complete